MYNGLTNKEVLESICERIGMKAASVFPPAVEALMITSVSRRRTGGMEFS